MGIDLGGVQGLLVAFVGAAGEGGEGVGLGIIAVEGLLAGDGGLLEDGHLLLGHGLGLAAHHDHVGAVLGIEHERLAHLRLEDAFETRNHVVLGHPADAAELAVRDGSLVRGIDGGQVGEVATFLDHGHEAVRGAGGVRILEKDVLDERGVGQHLAVQHAGGIEGVAIVHDLRDGGAAEDLVVQLGVDGAQLAGLVPVVVQAAVGVLEQEGAHVVRRGELVVSLGDGFAGGGDVGIGGNDLIDDVLDLAVGVLLEERLVGLVVGTDLVGSDGHGAVLGHGVVHHEVVHVGGRVAFLDGLGKLKGVVLAAGGEQGAVFGVELLVVHRVLEVVPIGAQLAALVAVNLLDEGLQALCGEGAGLIHEDGVLLDDGGNIVAAHQGHHLVLADGQAGFLGVLDKHVFVQKLLPGRVADLLLGLLGAGGAGEELVDGRVTVDVSLEVRVGHSLACNLADIELGRHRIECRLQRAGIDNE